MQTFLLQFDNYTTGLARFEYSYEMASEAMAIDYARRMVKYFAPMQRDISSFILWNVTRGQTEATAEMICRLELAAPTVEVKDHLPRAAA